MGWQENWFVDEPMHKPIDDQRLHLQRVLFEVCSHVATRHSDERPIKARYLDVETLRRSITDVN